MGKVLTQQEIDAVVQSARRAKTTDAEVPQRVIRTWDFHAAGKLAQERARVITSLHEAFARHLTRSLGAYLRVPFEAALMTVEQVPYRDFFEMIPELAYTMSFLVRPNGLFAALHFDTNIVFSMVDVVLGGTGGEVQELVREVSEIEARIMERITSLVCVELQNGWEALGLTVQLDQRQQRTQMQQFLPATEKVLVLSFELKVAEVRGMMNLLLPASMSKLIARELARDWGHNASAAAGQTLATHKVQERLLQCRFSTELGLPSVRVTMRELLSLRPGDVLPLRVPANQQASFIIGGQQAFEADAVRFAAQRAARLGRRMAVNIEPGRTRP